MKQKILLRFNIKKHFLLPLFLLSFFQMDNFAQNCGLKNPSFENSTACPTGFRQFDLVADWTNLLPDNVSEPDYFNESCPNGPIGGFNYNGYTDVDGTVSSNLAQHLCGRMGMYLNKHSGSNSKLKQYIAQRVDLKAGVTYQISIDIALSTNGGTNDLQRNLNIFGYNGSIPAGQTDFCPIGADSLATISRFTISTSNNTRTVTFTPTQNYNYLALGAQCGGIQDATATGYIFIDKIELTSLSDSSVYTPIIYHASNDSNYVAPTTYGTSTAVACKNCFSDFRNKLLLVGNKIPTGVTATWSQNIANPESVTFSTPNDSATSLVGTDTLIPGFYTFYYTFSQGGCSITDSILVEVKQQIKLTAGPDIMSCGGNNDYRYNDGVLQYYSRPANPYAPNDSYTLVRLLAPNFSGSTGVRYRPNSREHIWWSMIQDDSTEFTFYNRNIIPHTGNGFDQGDVGLYTGGNAQNSTDPYFQINNLKDSIYFIMNLLDECNTHYKDTMLLVMNDINLRWDKPTYCIGDTANVYQQTRLPWRNNSLNVVDPLQASASLKFKWIIDDTAIVALDTNVSDSLLLIIGDSATSGWHTIRLEVTDTIQNCTVYDEHQFFVKESLASFSAGSDVTLCGGNNDAGNNLSNNYSNAWRYNRRYVRMNATPSITSINNNSYLTWWSMIRDDSTEWVFTNPCIPYDGTDEGDVSIYAPETNPIYCGNVRSTRSNAPNTLFYIRNPRDTVKFIFNLQDICGEDTVVYKDTITVIMNDVDLIAGTTPVFSGEGVCRKSNDTVLITQINSIYANKLIDSSLVYSWSTTCTSCTFMDTTVMDSVRLIIDKAAPAGVYLVRLTVRDTLTNCEWYDEHRINIYAPSVTLNSIYAGNDQFLCNSNFANQIIYMGASPTRSVITANRYTTYWGAIQPDGSEFIFNNPCVPGDGTNDGVIRIWTTGGGCGWPSSQRSHAPNARFYFNTFGERKMVWHVIDKCDTTIHLTDTVLVRWDFNEPTVNAGVDQTPSCNAVELVGNLSASSSGNSGCFLWRQISGPSQLRIIDSTSNVAYVVAIDTAAIGAYQFEYNLGCGFCAIKDTMTLNVTPGLTRGTFTLSSSWDGTSTLCIGDSIEFNASGAAQYAWFINDTLAKPFSNDSTFKFVALKDTVSVFVLSKDASGFCIANTDSTIQFNGIPCVERDTISICSNESACVSTKDMPFSYDVLESCSSDTTNVGSILSFTDTCMNYQSAGYPISWIYDTVCVVLKDLDQEVYDTTVVLVTNCDSSISIACNDTTLYLNALGDLITIDTSFVLDSVFASTGVDSVWLDINSFNCSNVGANTVTIYARNNFYNKVVSCQAIVTILDTINPVIVCSDYTAYLDNSGVASISPITLVTGATDNCGMDSVWLSRTEFTCSDDTVNVKVYITDIHGNLDSCESIITVLDTISPAINDATVCNNVLDWDSELWTPGTVSNSYTVGTTQLRFTVTDASGALLTPPVSPVPLPANAPFFQGDLPITEASLLLSADFGVLDTTNSIIFDAGLGQPGIGVSNLEFKVFDIDGGTGIFERDEHLQIMGYLNGVLVSPMLTPNGAQVVSGNTVIGSVQTAATGGNSSDGVVLISFPSAIDSLSMNFSAKTTITPNPGSTPGFGIHDFSFCVVSDTSLNGVSDTLVYLDSSGIASIDTSFFVKGLYDNCSVDSVWLSQTSFSCSDSNHLITVTAVDPSGNTTSDSARLFILDTISPSVTVNDTTLYMSASGIVYFDTSHLVTSSWDNCSVDSIWLSIDSATCSQDSVLVTIHITDVNGNANTSLATVYVIDTIAPEFDSIPVDQTYSCLSELPPVMGLNATDNCQVDTSFVTEYVVGLDTSLGIGISNVFLPLSSYGAFSGYSSSKNAEYYFETGSAVSMLKDFSVVARNFGGVGSVTVNLHKVNAVDTSIGALITSVGSFNITSTAALITVSDSNGTLLSPNTQYAYRLVSSSSYLLAMYPGLANPDSVYSDMEWKYVKTNSTILVGGKPLPFVCRTTATIFDSVSCDNKQNIIRVYTAIDNQNNETSLIQNIRINDSVAPNITCKDTTLYLDSSGLLNLDTSYLITGYSDNCGVDSVWISQTTGSCVDDTINYTVFITDVCGNIDSCSNQIIVLDTISPIVNLSNDTVYLDGLGNASTSLSNIENGSTDNCGITSITLSDSTYTCANVGPNTVTVTVTDNSGNVSTGTATVFVVDTIAPFVRCRNVTLYLDSAGNAIITASDIDNGSTDNCDTITLSASQTAFTCSDLGQNTVTLTVTDAYGNTDSCVAMVTVIDIIAPVANCKPDTLYLNASGVATLAASDIDNGSSDNCSVSLSVSQTTFSCSDLGANTVTLTATDAQGLSSTCTTTVTLLDTLAPMMSCQSVTVNLDASGVASITTADVNNGSSDNCSGVTLSLSQTTFTCADLGANTVTLIGTDASGNVDSCTATVTVVDVIVPIALCKPTTIYLDSTGTASLTEMDIDNGSTDNCGVTLSISDSIFTCSDAGANTVTLTATDAAGNTSTCVAVVTVVDTIAPVAQCKADTLYLNASGTASLTASMIDNGSVDNCSSLTMSVSQTTYTCADLGVSSATLTVTDVSGNTSTCTSSITVMDTLAPMMSCTPATIYLDALGMATLTASQVDGGSSDNCGITMMSVSRSSFTCADLGTTTVTLTGVDASGNTSTCTSTVTIMDTLAPVVLCKSATIALDATGNATITTLDVDNGSSDNCGITLSLSNRSFNCMNVGVNTVTLTGVDAAGNTASCVATVTVVDNMAPTAICQNITIQLDSNGKASITALDVDGGSTDNCAIASIVVSQTNFDCSHLGMNTVTLTVTDIYGNVAICSATVTVEDNIAPVAYCPGDKQTVVRNTTCSYILPDYTSESTSWDNCSINRVTITQTPAPGSEVLLENTDTTITITATDGSGNTSTCSFQLYARCVKELNIPQFISPDGNGKNDTWEIPELANYPDNTVKVFNRWGNLVFEQKGYYSGWDGISNVGRGANRLMDNKMLPEGTYFYIIDLGEESSIEPYVGYMQIKR